MSSLSERRSSPASSGRGGGSPRRYGGVCLASSAYRLVRMTSIAASVAAPNIVDHRLRFLVLHLERRDQRGLRRNGHALALTRDVYSNREFERHAPISSEGSLVTIRPPAGALIPGPLPGASRHPLPTGRGEIPTPSSLPRSS